MHETRRRHFGALKGALSRKTEGLNEGEMEAHPNGLVALRSIFHREQALLRIFLGFSCYLSVMVDESPWVWFRSDVS